MTETFPAEIECVMCGGIGCEHCERGRFAVIGCPSEFIGQRLIDEINIVDACDDGVLPVAGGLLDQPAYYHELARTLKNEVNQIEMEKHKKK